MLHTLPPEIFARVLEIAIETWGIGFLPSICLVSSTCRDVVLSTPSLWGIFVVDRQSSLSLLSQQLAKAKATDLRITFSGKGWPNSSTHKNTRRFMASLTPLAHNWVRLELPTGVLSLARWADLGRIEVLSLRQTPHGLDPSTADTFFEQGATYTQPSLHSFTASGLPEEWVTRFLSPRITFFEIGRLWSTPASTIQRYLSRIPNVHTLSLQRISFLPLSASNLTVTLPHLHNLEIANVSDFTPLLLNTRAPALRGLSICDCTGQMGRVFSQWSQPDFLPGHLQSLELSDSLSELDMPFLIRWLARLPALLRLTITDTGEFDASTSSVETDLLLALASPHGAGSIVGGWLCPSLTYLCLDTPLCLVDILPIARARCAPSPGSPAKLRAMHAHLCSNGTADELAEFRSFFTEEADASCLCLGCAFNLSSMWNENRLRRMLMSLQYD
ncbi:hypothetical protein B0H17DRAFT_1083158 [Mycena rosella]|uniref:Uncharacterized protein n=1 Tax=Mycena rosella TaxID=1033263 RepID=A0AAD7D0W3_MYCRO|nr:hypothetical protein B0H17DRAFT_1083158 [Mycena rosella]